ncbi:MAG: prepilin-type N-terminal cleavage/methylation domain-containing protein [Candidatus Daviesbacteria bacterium]|nr:prepilin-type N-terminal cleavage/methylation domain-containing protein [Candidatus Daviesbacteria bacterium]
MKGIKGFSAQARSRGFTLIELLVVIAVLAILATIGVAVFSGVTNAARDTKRKTDLNNISKAYEIKYSNLGSYQTLTNTDFSSGNIPKMPEGGDYPCLIGPSSNCITQAIDRFAICVGLGSQGGQPCYASSSTCQCISSIQNSTFLGGGGGGGGGGSSPSCDPYGVLTSGLAGYWKMDDNVSGDQTLIDSSSNRYDGLARVATNGTGMDCTITGKNRGGCSFDGVDDYIAVSSFPASDGIVGETGTVAGWIKIPSSQVSKGIVSFTGSKPIFYFNGSGGLQAYNADSDIYSCSIPISSIPLNTYNHIAWVWDNNNIKSYLNGSEQCAGTWETTFNRVVGTLYIGSYGGSVNVMSGFLDDLRVYNRALSSSEISALYNSGTGCAL